MSNQPGKTLWEMAMDRVRGSGNGTGVAFANPLDLRVGSLVPIAYANGPHFSDLDFTVREIREDNRRIGPQEFRFTDYVIQGIDKKTFDASAAIIARLRCVPNLAGGNDTLLLQLYDEFAFAEDFLSVLKDTTGRFDVTEDETGQTQSFTRVNQVLDSYEAAVLVVSQTTPEGRAVASQTSAAKLEYWDYSRQLEIGEGKSSPEFMFVEMNADTGWFQLWQGKEFFVSGGG